MNKERERQRARHELLLTNSRFLFWLFLIFSVPTGIFMKMGIGLGQNLRMIQISAFVGFILGCSIAFISWMFARVRLNRLHVEEQKQDERLMPDLVVHRETSNPRIRLDELERDHLADQKKKNNHPTMGDDIDTDPQGPNN
jgi:hypothetical protein